ncbi:MAG: LacI family DNA-binding transcriptional regulator [Phycisphaeraceae bacterium]
MPPVTIYQIAADLGVSRQTVSAILRGKEHLYRRETCERVRAAAERLGYRPNAHARSMRTGRFGAAGLLMSSSPSRSRMPQPLLDAICETLAEHELHLIVGKLPDERLTQTGAVPKILREWSVDGLLVNYDEQVPPGMVARIQEEIAPTVWLNARLEHNCVRPDNVHGGALAARHLLELGHRRIGYLDFIQGWDDLDEAHFSVGDRQLGYEQAMREAGFQPQVIRAPRHVDTADRAAFAREQLSGDERVTAVVVSGGAQFVIHAATTLGLSVPDDLSVVAIGDQPVAAGIGWVDIALVPLTRLGRAGVEAMLERIAQPEAAMPAQTVPFKLDHRGTTTAPPPVAKP